MKLPIYQQKAQPIVKAVLVYQAGIANVFAVQNFDTGNPEHRSAKRLLQGSFSTCEDFARGIAATGIPVRSAQCNMAGDITQQPWNDELDSAPFSHNFRPVNLN